MMMARSRTCSEEERAVSRRVGFEKTRARETYVSDLKDAGRYQCVDRIDLALPVEENREEGQTEDERDEGFRFRPVNEGESRRCSWMRTKGEKKTYQPTVFAFVSPNTKSTMLAI